MVEECNLAVIIFLPKLAEFRIANIGAPLAFSCLAKDRLASSCGDTVRAFFKIGFSSLVRAVCLILKKVREDVTVCSSGRILILAIRVHRCGLC